jgi:hypothetical protein
VFIREGIAGTKSALSRSAAPGLEICIHWFAELPDHRAQAVAICCALPVNACLWPTNDELTDAIVGSGAWRMLRVQ